MNWRKRTSSTTVDGVMEELSGVPANELLDAKPDNAYKLAGMLDLVKLIEKALIEKTGITIVGDYDADGICGTAILYLLFSHLGITPSVRLPKRMSEGYGLSVRIIDEILQDGKTGFLITVDNGIAASEAIEKARANGIEVAVIDHHLSDSLPPANVIVDPKVIPPDADGWDGYCGAGLALKVAECFLASGEKNGEFHTKLMALAAIATVADVMPLHRENRVIVQTGLNAINSGTVSTGLASLLSVLEKEYYCEDDIGYLLAPILNAAGRMYDDGAKIPCALLSTDDGKLRTKTAERLLFYNEERKNIVKRCSEKIEKQADAETGAPILVFDETIPEGIVGIVAGKLCEKYNLPAIVCTKGENGCWKGSARSIDGLNIKERLDAVADTLLGYGGHAGAAGVQIAAEKKEAFVGAIRAACEDITNTAEEVVLEYDLEIDDSRVVETYRQLAGFAPFGEGCPMPVVRISGVQVNYLRFMGEEDKHFRFSGDSGCSYVAFNLGKEAAEKNIRDYSSLDVVCTLKYERSSKWGNKLVANIIDFEVC